MPNKKSSLNRFNPRTHTGCDKVEAHRYADMWVFQSTHPHGVRPASLYNSNTREVVSIHAPTRGATMFTSLDKIKVDVSIHAPTRGATGQLLIYSSAVIGFNPRTHTGCDNALIVTSFWHDSFNPRTHTGCDSGKRRRYDEKLEFQSTHPHGVRLSLRLEIECVISFNPRTHTGCDMV